MNKYYYLVIFFLLSSVSLMAQTQTGGVSIGKDGEAAHANAILELVSTNRGVLIPRMTSDQRKAIFGGTNESAKGLLVFDIIQNAFYFWDGTAWQTVASASAKIVTGVPTVPGVPGEIAFDGTNSDMYVYSGAMWVKVTDGSSSGSSGSGSNVYLSPSIDSYGVLYLGTQNGSAVSVDLSSMKVVSASGISVSPNASVGLSASNVQDALLELQSEITSASGGGMLSVVHDATLVGTGVAGYPLGIAANAISATQITNNSITPAKIQPGSLNTVLTTNAYGAVEWAAASSGSGGGGGITAVLVDGTSITGNGTTAALSVLDGGITNTKIASRAISSTKLQGITSSGTSGQYLVSDGAGGFVWNSTSGSGITAVMHDRTLDGLGTISSPLVIATKGVETENLADWAVTSKKIEDEAITTFKLADRSVTESKLAYNAVAEQNIMNNAITNDKLADNAVTTNELADGAVTYRKLQVATGMSRLLGSPETSTVIGEISLGGGLTMKGSTLSIQASALEGQNVTSSGGTINVGGGTGASLNAMTLDLAPNSVSTTYLAPAAVTAAKLNGISGNGVLGQVLISNGSGGFSWSTVSAGGGGGITSVLVDGSTITGDGVYSALSVGNITDTKLSGISASGNSGQVLTSNGSGGFIWSNSGAGGGLSTVATDGTTISGNGDATPLYVVNGGITPLKLNGITGNGTTDYVLSSDGAGGFAWKAPGTGGMTAVAVDNTTISGDGVSSDLYLMNNSVSTVKIQDEAVTNNKIKDNAITDDKLSGISYHGTEGQLLTSDGSGGFKWDMDFILPSGSGSSGYVLKTDGAGNLSWGVDATAAAGSGIASLGLSLPLYTNFNTLTADGTLTADLATQAANTVLAGPTSGGARTPTFRKVVAADIDPESASNDQVLTIVAGVPTWADATGGGGSGLSSVSVDNITITGDGDATDLSIKAGGVGTTELAASAVTNAKITNQTIEETKLKGVSVAGTAGQVLTSDGAGGFEWNNASAGGGGGSASNGLDVDATSGDIILGGTLDDDTTIDQDGKDLTLTTGAGKAIVDGMLSISNANGGKSGLFLPFKEVTVSPETYSVSDSDIVLYFTYVSSSVKALNLPAPSDNAGRVLFIHNITGRAITLTGTSNAYGLGTGKGSIVYCTGTDWITIAN